VLIQQLSQYFGLPYTSGPKGGVLETPSNCDFAGDGFCDTEPDFFSLEGYAIDYDLCQATEVNLTGPQASVSMLSNYMSHYESVASEYYPH